VTDAAAVVAATLEHPLMLQAAAADREGRCHREWPVTLRTDLGEIIDGVIDLLFFADGRWTVVDYKTGRLEEVSRHQAELQIGWYVRAVSDARQQPTRGVLFEI